MPMVGLGTWKIPREEAQNVVYEAIKVHGVRHIDCACDYGNEKEVGLGIKQAIDEGVVTREDLWITSKLWNTYHRYEHVLPAAQKSLSDLQLSHFDLYMIHFPISLKFVPFEERYPPEWIHDPKAEMPRLELDFGAPTHMTWKAMEELVDQGLSRFIGVCNFNVQHVMDLLSYARIKPYANQVELHPYLSQLPLVDFCQRQEIKVTAFSPFGSASYVVFGMDYGLNRGLLDDATVRGIADKYGRTNAQVLLRWSTQRGIAVIPKTSNLNHLAENMNVHDFTLSEEDVSMLFSYCLSANTSLLYRWTLSLVLTRIFASITLVSSASSWEKRFQSLIKCL